jgi:spore germination cell wall hydrolase CwlJ-like protein
MRLITDDKLGAITVWQEARGEPWEGKLAVAEVIRRRTATKYDSDGTIAGTIGRKAQFSGWNPSDPNFLPSLSLDDQDPVVNECIHAWYQSEHTNHSNGAVLYCNTRISNPSWARADKKVAEIGKHSFFVD